MLPYPVVSYEIVTICYQIDKGNYMLKLFLLFTALPILELYVLLEIGSLLGVYRTVGVILITAIVGASMWKTQGLIVLRKINDRLKNEDIPGNELLEGLLVLAGGLFLVTPGFLTDAAGFLCLLPASRTWFAKLLKQWLRKQVETGNIQIFVSGFDKFRE